MFDRRAIVAPEGTFYREGWLHAPRCHLTVNSPPTGYRAVERDALPEALTQLPAASHLLAEERAAAPQSQGSWRGPRSTASSRAASSQALGRSGAAAGVGAVSRMKRSSAATTAAASSGEADGATICSWGRRFGTGRHDASP